MEKIISHQIPKEGFIESLQQELSKPLPAYAAQKLMEPPLRNTLHKDTSSAREAATMLLLYYDVSWKFILIKRSSHPQDKHKGQVSFPGGSVEAQESYEEAALREAFEEINVPQHQVDLIGSISPLFIPVSNFMVYPFIGLVDIKSINLTPQPSEVAEILTLSLDEFMDQSAISYMDMNIQNGLKINDVPYYKIANKIVWGATAMMMSEFREICKRIL